MKKHYSTHLCLLFMAMMAMMWTGVKADDFTGYDADSDCNLFKSCTYTNSYYYAPGWSQIDDPEMTVDGNSFTVVLPTATTDQWQAQVFFQTDMVTNSSTNYDFSAKFLSTTDHSSVTVKLYQNGDDGTYYFTEKIKLTAGEEYVFYQSDMAGIDMTAVNIVLDFGGNAENTTVTVYDIDLQEHACDGIEAPEEEVDDFEGYDADSECNLFSTDDCTLSFYYAPGWSEISAPDVTVSGNTYSFTLATATTDQWQAQAFFDTSIETNSSNSYDFSCKITSSTAHSNVTVKLYQSTDDNTFYFSETLSLTAGEEYVFYDSDMSGYDMTGVRLLIDFGGNAENTAITVSDIVLKESDCDDGTGISNVDAASDGTYNVYTVSGMHVMKTTEIGNVMTLPAGTYIVNNKKIIVK